MEPERKTKQRKDKSAASKGGRERGGQGLLKLGNGGGEGEGGEGRKKEEGKGAGRSVAFTFRLPAEKEGGALERLRESLRRQTRKRREERRRCEPLRMVASMVSQVGRGGMAGSSSDEES